MPSKRIIACLDVKGGRVVKGVQFEGHVDAGDPLDLALRYRDEGADEIVIYDIAASAERRTIDYDWLARVARRLDVPLCVAGGIRTSEQAIGCLEHGADKVSINSPALERPEFINELADVAGSQCVVVGVDSRATEGVWSTFQYTGDAATIRRTPRKTMEWIVEAQARGAGEIVLNCMDRDGTRDGFDIEQLAVARRLLTIPLVASGGAGAAQHFADVFAGADVSGALAASIFHFRRVGVGEVKSAVAAAGYEVRP
ncbi:imidazole glycerol phosphate synthase subunit HisF [Candidatus Viadribacter manganicus]|uniref:Imidazole glycerol phosphate synthase subunit HisF n=1 Tax=Candidatus Viadribacter manganicus TaxID=1759059 RepID=A0A1B1AIF6_9PROT|nr:imidazole glycerol phosphate synthase subunit HisF [Candidatus Viadribacter manganicus]ANP46347.1 imidazole glycerol phosphate synthase cyclase subunit [Candidatus Viadribacter manganicus]